MWMGLRQQGGAWENGQPLPTRELALASVACPSPLAPLAPLAPKINPKTESWVRFPAKVVALTQKMESWIRYPGGNYTEVNASAESKSWVRYPSANSQNLAISNSTQSDQSEWVRYVAKN